MKGEVVANQELRVGHAPVSSVRSDRVRSGIESIVEFVLRRSLVVIMTWTMEIHHHKDTWYLVTPRVSNVIQNVTISQFLFPGHRV